MAAKMKPDLRTLSKTISHALRHAPWLYELELDDEGWTSVEAVLDALREKRSRWENVSQADLEAIIATSEKRRFELSDGRIRALYGHSLPKKLRKTSAPPPDVLYHGTVRAAMPAILESGLKPMSRQYVHLSIDVETARQVARRKGSDVVILRIDAARAHSEGVTFYEGNEMVWLADRVPPAYFQPEPS